MRAAIVMAMLALLSLIDVAPAQTGSGYDLHWNTQDAGGVSMNGANGYSLTGTIAQPDATPNGGMVGAANYALRGGFWPGLHEATDIIFRNGFN